MTAEVHYLDPCRPRRHVNRDRVCAMSPAQQVVPLKETAEGDPEDYLTMEVYCPSGVGMFRQTAPARTFIGRRVGLSDGSTAEFRGHFWVHGVCFVRATTAWRVIREPTNRVVLMPENNNGKGAA